MEEITERAEKTLDRDRPSHGGTYLVLTTSSDWRHPSGGNHSKASFFLCFHASVVSIGCILWKFVAVANRGFDRFQVVIGYRVLLKFCAMGVHFPLGITEPGAEINGPTRFRAAPHQVSGIANLRVGITRRSGKANNNEKCESMLQHLGQLLSRRL